MEMVFPLSLLLLLILSECFWISIATTDSQVADMVTVSSSFLDQHSLTSQPPLEAVSLPGSDSDTTLMSSTALDATLLTSLMTEARDSTPTAEVASSTTFDSGLTSVDKKDLSSTQELTTHVAILSTSVKAVVAAVTTPSIPPPFNATGGQEGNTTLVTKETTPSHEISTGKTTSTSYPGSQTTSTSSLSLTSVSPAKKLQDGSNSALVILVVVIVVATLFVVLFFLWRRRQRRRTGALMLVGNGKHKGAGDAWAGPVQGVEEQAASGSAAGEGDTMNPEGEGTGRRPTLTTFFGKRKSRQDSVMLEDLEAGAATSDLKVESEPLVEKVDEAVKPPEADGLSADESVVGDGNLPSSPVTNV
ncbi:leukosialin [Sarcophilus harrisii]|uniref:Sialophorin n=1 Tax=Sarcophilus harrisii TaxID=9305 RepID=A0A7N4NXN4_SARHA|nr:leukosialin [Sarcophilus harrisii]